MKLKIGTQNKGTLSVAEFFSLLLNSVTQVHIFHFQSKSYSEHMALGAYYEGVSDLADSLIEAYQGKYGIVKGYGKAEFKDITDTVIYFEGLHSKVESVYTVITDSDLQNQLDEIKTLIKSTIYKLENLK